MRMRQSIGIWAAAGGLLLALTSAGLGQQGSGNGRGSQPPGPLGAPSITPILPTETDAPSATMQEQARLRSSVDRQKRLVMDTEKLLALANELKSDVDKSNKDTLSLDVIRKAEEIEKLAHSVKEKMKGN